MASAEIPTYVVTQILVGNTTVPNPVLFLKIGNATYTQGFRITYGTSGENGYRNIYPAYDPTTGNVLIVSQTLAGLTNVPSISLANIGVMIIG